MEYKTCKKCNRNLPLENFPKDNRSKDKKWRFCRECESNRKKESRNIKTFLMPFKDIYLNPYHTPPNHIIQTNIPFFTISLKVFRTNFKNKSGRSLNIKYGSSHYGGMHYDIDHSIYINLKALNKYAKIREVTLIKVVCETISHEVFHAILEDNEGDLANRQWDNIARGLRGYGMD